MLRFIDGAELGNVNKYDLGSAITWLGTSGRRGGGAHSTNGNSTFKNLGTGAAEMIFGCAFFPAQVTNCGVGIFQEGATVHVDVRIVAGKLRVTRNGTQLGTDGATTLVANAWYYIEARALIHDTTGEVEVRLNGAATPEILVTGVDTRNGGSGVIDRYTLGGNNSQGNFCDIYVLDKSGTKNNNFLGDVKVETRFPMAAGNSAQFTPNAGANWDRVDENGNSDADTTYVSSATVGHKDTHATQDLATTSGVVLGVGTYNRWRKDDAGTRTARRVIRSGGTDYEGPDVTVLDSYQSAQEIIELNPDGGVDWTIAAVNALEVGYKVQA